MMTEQYVVDVADAESPKVVGVGVVASTILNYQKKKASAGSVRDISYRHRNMRMPLVLKLIS